MKKAVIEPYLSTGGFLTGDFKVFLEDDNEYASYHLGCGVWIPMDYSEKDAIKFCKRHGYIYTFA